MRGRRYLTALLVLAVAACGGGGDSATSTSSSTSAAPAAIDDRTVDIGGRSLHLVCEGSGSPTVLIEMGVGQSVSQWNGLQPTLAKANRTCVYERAGAGTSDPGPVPRTAEAVATDLQALIDAVPIETPVVLVSHSLGGMYAQLFAAQHPDEIAGLVFLDPRTAEFQLGYRDHLTPEERAADDLDTELAIKNETFGPEIAGADASAAQVLAAGPLPNVPLVVLTAGLSGVDSAAGTAFWRETHDSLAAQLPNGVNEIVDGAEHEIWLTHEQVVVDAVKAVTAGG